MLFCEFATINTTHQTWGTRVAIDFVGLPHHKSDPPGEMMVRFPVPAAVTAPNKVTAAVTANARREYIFRRLEVAQERREGASKEWQR